MKLNNIGMNTLVILLTLSEILGVLFVIFKSFLVITTGFAVLSLLDALIVFGFILGLPLIVVLTLAISDYIRLKK